MIDASDSETAEGLERGESVAEPVGFMLAGYETTSTALTFATYLLAANPEAQERLANEIHECFELNPVCECGQHAFLSVAYFNRLITNDTYMRQIIACASVPITHISIKDKGTHFHDIFGCCERRTALSSL